MIKTSLITSVALIASLNLVGCSSGSGDTATTATSTAKTTVDNTLETIYGTAIDPELQGATVCLDTNLDENCTEDEPSTTTDRNGNFSLNVTTMQLEGTAPLVAINGVDKESGETFKGKLIADVDSNYQNITPLTTLAYKKIQENMDKGLENIQSGMSSLEDTLSLSSEEMQGNMIVLANEGNTTALKVALVLEKSAEAIVPTNTLQFYKKLSSEINDSKALTLLDSIMKITPSDLKDQVKSLVEDILNSDISDPYALAEEARTKAIALGIDQKERMEEEIPTEIPEEMPAHIPNMP